MNIQHPLSQYIAHFFNDYLSLQRGLSHNTILAYRDGLKLLFGFVSKELKQAIEKLTIEQLDHKIVVAFLEHLETHRHVTIKTRNARLAAIRTLFTYLAHEEPCLLPQCQLIKSIAVKKAPHKVIEYLNKDEMAALFQSIDLHTQAGVRDNALLLLMFNTGARAQEVVDLKLSDLRLDKTGQIRILGKGKKQRTCPLWSETVDAIKQYLHNRNNKDQQSALFLNAKGGSFSRFGIRYIVKKYGDIAAKKENSMTEKHIGPHTIRHSTAMHLLKSGNEINMVGIWLGHASINTTHAYLEIDLEMKKEMLDKTAPPISSAESSQCLWKQDKIVRWLDSLTIPKKLCAAN